MNVNAQTEHTCYIVEFVIRNPITEVFKAFGNVSIVKGANCQVMFDNRTEMTTLGCGDSREVATEPWTNKLKELGLTIDSCVTHGPFTIPWTAKA